MEADDKSLNLFSTRVRQMILQYSDLKKQNAALAARIAEQQESIRLLQEQTQQMQADYNSLKMARMVEITNGDMENAQKRLAQLIRDVNKCITLISEA